MHGCFSYFSLQPKPLIQLAVLIVPPVAVALMEKSTSTIEKIHYGMPWKGMEREDWEFQA